MKPLVSNKLLILIFVAFSPPSFAVVNCTGKKMDAKK